MQRYEYKVVPAPPRGDKVRGARTTAERFAAAMMTVMNDLGRDGWEYLRADTLPCEERVGLTGKASSFQHMLVFRRLFPQQAVSVADDQPATSRGRLVAAAPEGAAPRVMPFVKPAVASTPVPPQDLGKPTD